MELNGYSSPIGTAPIGSPVTFYIKATIEQAAALNDQTLTMTHADKTIAIYPDYQIINIKQEPNGIVAITAQRVLEPDTQATLERLEQAQENQILVNQNSEEKLEQLADSNDMLQEEVDIHGNLLEALLSSQEEDTGDDIWTN